VEQRARAIACADDERAARLAPDDVGIGLALLLEQILDQLGEAFRALAEHAFGSADQVVLAIGYRPGPVRTSSPPRESLAAEAAMNRRRASPFCGESNRAGHLAVQIDSGLKKAGGATKAKSAAAYLPRPIPSL
jgi:hypothetical protein